MKKFSEFISNKYILIFVLCLALIVPAVIGYMNTRINYDILVYLPDDVDTIKGEKILTDDFSLGSYAFVMIDMNDTYKVLKIEDKIKKIEGVNRVFSVADVLGTEIPKEMLPDEVIEKVYSDNTSVIMVTFDGSMSEDSTVNAVREIRKVVGDANKVSSMTSMIIDTMDLSDQEFLIYVGISVLLCLIVLTIATNSYAIPGLLLANIGVAILYNLGSNVFLGEISYITKAITAILQLGVTTDF